MSIISDKFFDIDYNTNRLIFIFKSGRYQSMDLPELSWMVGQLNEYQYLKLLDSLDLSILKDSKYFHLFFTLIFSNDSTSNIAVGVGFNYTKTKYFIDFVSEPERQLLYLLKYREETEKKSFPLLRSLRSKLIEIKSVHNSSGIKYSLKMNFIEEDDYGNVLGDNGSATACEEEQYLSVFDIVRNETYYNFEFDYDWATNSTYQLTKNELIKHVKLLHFDFLNKPLNHNLQVIFLSVFTVIDWQKFIITKLSPLEKELFRKHKDFFFTCLRHYKEALGYDYIKTSSKSSKRDIQGDFVYPITGYADVSKMLHWIDELDYPLKQEGIKMTDFKPDKLLLSNNFSQKTLLKVLIKYFETSNINFDENALHSLIVHHTTIEMTKNNKGYKSKYLEDIEYKEIDFIPEDKIVDLIKIFLKLLEKGIIKTGKYKTFDIISLMLQTSGSKGISKSNVRYYWQQRNKIKAGLRVGNETFWYFFLAKC